MARDRTPEAVAQAVCEQHWPVGTKRLVYREEVEAVMASLIRRIREQDARLCTRPIGGYRRWPRAGTEFAAWIRAQNRKPT